MESLCIVGLESGGLVSYLLAMKNIIQVTT